MRPFTQGWENKSKGEKRLNRGEGNDRCPASTEGPRDEHFSLMRTRNDLLVCEGDSGFPQKKTLDITASARLEKRTSNKHTSSTVEMGATL